MVSPERIEGVGMLKCSVLLRRRMAERCAGSGMERDKVDELSGKRFEDRKGGC